MNKMILCEGKTDAVLLSYYFEKKLGWQHVTKTKECPIPKINVDENKGESAYWYKKDKDFLLICGVGGCNRFGTFFEEKLKNSILLNSIFSKVAIVTDKDDRSDEEIIREIFEWAKPIQIEPIVNTWTHAYYPNSFPGDEPEKLEWLVQIIPFDEEGALETVLLEAISEDPIGKNIVDKSRAFVEDVSTIAQHYLKARRMKLKAVLSVTWAIQSPDKCFHFIDRQIRSIPWEKSERLHECFSELEKI